MTLEQFVARLHGAGCDLHVEDLLDAFWLATRGRHLSLRGPGPADWQPDAATDAESGSDLPDQGPAVAPRPDKRREEVPIYGAGRVADDQRTVAASAVALPAGQPLPGRLELARALRPLRARWPSRTQLEVDELATVEASAEHRGALYPVFRPVPEPWFDAHVVLEDDPAITLWRDTMQSFSRMLEDTGAFRSVASWRLRGAARQAPSGGDRDGAWLEGPAGLRAGPRLLAGGGVRRLIFFVTHGGSAGWLDGRYARVLAPWARTSSVLILHLFDRHRWLRGTLGDVHGTCAAPVPGAITADFDVATFWWRAPPDPAGLVPIPAVPLTPAGLGDWALTLMARGRRSPVFLLDPVPPPVADAPLNAAPLDYERAVGLLRESSPAAFRLAVALARSAFTIPVARVVQESRLAAGAGQSDLAEVLLSGLVFARSPPTDSDQADCWFDFDDAARAVLLRSLRKADAEAIANDLEERVSRYLERIGGRAISFRALVPDARGKYQLPDWAQPFAHFGLAVLRPTADARALQQRAGADPSASEPARADLAEVVSGPQSADAAATDQAGSVLDPIRAPSVHQGETEAVAPLSVYVSYAWKPPSQEIVDRLQAACAARGIDLQRDANAIKYGESIRDYMRRLGRGGAVVVVLSADYLRSENCMFELLEIEKNKDFHRRVYPILVRGTAFFRPLDRLEYIAFWEQQAEALEKTITRLRQQDHLSGAHATLDFYRDIRHCIGGLADILADMNALTEDVHVESDFAALINRLLASMGTLIFPDNTADPAPLIAGVAAPPDFAFARVLANEIDRELKSSAAGTLRAALADRLKAPAAVVGARLSEVSDAAALAALMSAIAACLRQAPRGEASRDLRATAQRLLGWLLMRLVREDVEHGWAGYLARFGRLARVEVGSEASAEVLWAYWSGLEQPPTFRVIRRRVVGSHNLLTGIMLSEAGWDDWSRYFDDAKAALWVALFGEQPPTTFGAAQDQQLRSAFAFDRSIHNGVRFYLTVRDDDIKEPLTQPAVLEALRRDLGLPVLFVAQGSDDRFISIGEMRLQDLIKQCLKVLKEHGDD